ncbi:hypothetical protein [Flavihumibacter profundi]|uniref:hypothetical protein n=1 Tax=Flavihumibacter profundi TaxID=2716883 RepID=UPI001CC69226|nr:hypothetical protein [Flavihumibacter profundi]MBZ5857766.1 hypothetical protein [Flavihumibacter profundi]
MQYILIPKYCDANSILVINNAGILRKLYCPFRVKCTTDTTDFKKGMWVWVEEVAATPTDELLYWVVGRPFPHTLFEIKLSF